MNQVEGLICPDFKIYYKVTIINTVLYWQEDRHINPEIYPYIYGQLIFDKDAEVSQREITSAPLSNSSVAGRTRYSYIKN